MPPVPVAEEEKPAWERRFRAAETAFPQWGLDAPERLVFASNESGSWQLHAWDRASGTRRRVTTTAIGVADGAITPDGEGVVWFDDPTGDERGRWVVAPFDARDDGRPQPLAEGVPEAWPSGLAIGRNLIVVGTGSEDGFRIHVAAGGRSAKEVYRHPDPVVVSGLSRDGSLLCYQHSEHGDLFHPALRVIDPRSGEVKGEQWDGQGLALESAVWSPVPGDRRLAFAHERGGTIRPAVWDLSTGERTDLNVELPGDVDVRGWWPDGSALLLVHSHDGRSELFRLDPSDEAAPVRVPHAPGTISGAAVRPDGEVWYRTDSGAEPPSIRSAGDDHVVLAAEGEPAPKGRAFRSFEFAGVGGHRVHGFVVTPEGQGPFPLLMDVHGGPSAAWTDHFTPGVQAWVDHGFAVAMVNYRGSTGYGREFRDQLLGNPGFPETQDVNAALEALVARGVADPERCVIAGASWGGYITLLSIGMHPDRWAAAVAGVPVADYPAAYADEAPALKAMDRSLFGGAPEDKPDLYEERSPLTYIENVKTPVLILAGDNDSRCPIRQIRNYVERLAELGLEFELYRYDAGHGSMVVEELVRQMRAELEFVTARVRTEPAQGSGLREGLAMEAAAEVE